MRMTRPQPIPAAPPSTRPPRKVSPGARYAIVAGLFFLLSMTLAVFGGIVVGRQEAEASQGSASSQAAQEQFDLGVQDLLNARYELARQRFEYVLTIDPAYPGVAELLDKSMAALNVPTNTPVPPTAVATPTATLDVSSLQGLYDQAQSALAAEDWTTAIQAVLTIRLRDSAFRREEGNQILAAATRGRGLAAILGGDHEIGIYFLTLSERFGTLDNSASAWKRSAAFYLYASSFFGLDWGQAVSLFSQLCTAGAWDSCRKYAEAAQGYADQLMKDDDPCAAVEFYEASLDTRPNDQLEPTASYAKRACETATAVPPTATASMTPTLGPTLELPTATPETPGPPTDTVEAPPTDTLVPSETPTPTETPTPS